MTHFFIFGDSIAQGAWDPFGGWVQRVRGILDQHFFENPDEMCLTFNMGVSGNTSQDVLNRFKGEVDVRFTPDTDTIILFAVGMSDSLVTVKDGTTQIALKAFQDNIKHLLEQAKTYTPKIGFVGLTPVDEDNVNPLPWNKSVSYWNANVYAYDRALKSICDDHDVTFVDIWDEWYKNPSYQDWLFDGVHPNERGHQRIARSVLKQFLRPLGIEVEPELAGGFITVA